MPTKGSVLGVTEYQPATTWDLGGNLSAPTSPSKFASDAALPISLTVVTLIHACQAGRQVGEVLQKCLGGQRQAPLASWTHWAPVHLGI